IDVYSPLYEDPLRVEFFGNTIESLRFFSAVNQRKTNSVSEVVILPAREAIVKKEEIAQIVSNIRKCASEIGLGRTKTRDIVDRIQHEGAFLGGESLISLIFDKLDTFFDYVPGNAHIVQIEPGELAEAAEGLQEQALKNFKDALEQGHLCVEPEKMYLQWDEAEKMLARRKSLSLKTLSVFKEEDPVYPSVRCSMSVEDNVAIGLELRKKQDTENLLLPLSEWLSDKVQSGYTIALVCHSKSHAERFDSLLKPYGVRLKFVDKFKDVKPAKDFINIVLGRVSSGFVWHDESLAIITEDEIFGTRHPRIKTPKHKVQTKLLEFADLKKKDLVVHVDHGIGQYQGLVKLKLNGATNDFLQISYKDNDKLYLPVDRMGLVQKYMGVDGITPVLDKMGGKTWERVKDRVKRSAEKIAGELLKLYAARKIKEGFSFKEIDNVYEDFEVGFSYEETQDQLQAINDTLNDMNESIPMDRLICGDVGYGKTEVALRASFLAVNNNKQVAVLVPTTVLAEQHFETFSSRFEQYPVQIACLNRFRSLSEQRKIVEGLKNGTVDIVIGTHRLVQKDIAFKDLGLLVLDEEQRFGVKHKEKLKRMKSSVDVLALTATPIPRTLHMSMMGIRDISIISTPPEHRRSIMTYISEYDDAIVSEAIRKELKRGGQIFYVHNKIHNIESMAKKLKSLVPEVELAVAHGRMNEDELEQVIFRFMNREIDLLVCTTIIESGLDIPSANTILVNRADKFGLAQIYQLRGRVGRAEEQAYAYLFIPQESHLTKDAQKRL
ncbi:MAG: transcription-repair coupling factor, partial [Deltaproteobacteria bacterium]|nr:transcription-repair coupling factor [Deltaproteobacteria bacterium]